MARSLIHHEAPLRIPAGILPMPATYFSGGTFETGRNRNQIRRLSTETEDGPQHSPHFLQLKRGKFPEAGGSASENQSRPRQPRPAFRCCFSRNQPAASHREAASPGL